MDVKSCEIICCGSVPLIGRSTVVFKSSAVVSAHTFAVLVEKPHHELSGSECLFGGTIVPFGCFLIVLRNAQAEHEDSAQFILSFAIALLGSPAQTRKISQGNVSPWLSDILWILHLLRKCLRHTKTHANGSPD